MAKSIKQKAIEHYDRMIEWAKKQPQNLPADDYIMQYYLGENWGADYCEHCKKYDDCIEDHCPLKGKRDLTCCNGWWVKMDVSKNWKTWIKNAEKAREYIRKNG